jgi:hypothetical protein
MPDTSSSPQERRKGEVRVRSNVCSSPHDWSLVPGDVLGDDAALVGQTEKQRRERMYYAPCSGCGRKICDILEDGCDNYTCGRQGIPSTLAAQRRKQARLEAGGNQGG